MESINENTVNYHLRPCLFSIFGASVFTGDELDRLTRLGFEVVRSKTDQTVSRLREVIKAEFARIAFQ